MVGLWRGHDIDSKMQASTCICRVGISHAHVNEAQGSTPASRVGQPSSKVGRSDSVTQASPPAKVHCYHLYTIHIHAPSSSPASSQAPPRQPSVPVLTQARGPALRRTTEAQRRLSGEALHACNMQELQYIAIIAIHIIVISLWFGIIFWGDISLSVLPSSPQAPAAQQRSSVRRDLRRK